MEETLRRMSQAANAVSGSRDLSLEELAEMYQVCFNPAYLGAAFEKVHGQILRMANKVINIVPEEDLVSKALQSLDQCMIEFDYTGSIKFFTVFTKYLHSEFTTLVQYYNYDKRKANVGAKYVDFWCSEDEGGYEFPDKTKNKERTHFELLNYLESLELEPLELSYCKCILNDCKSGVEIAEKLKVTTNAITAVKKELKNKLDPRMILC